MNSQKLGSKIFGDCLHSEQMTAHILDDVHHQIKEELEKVTPKIDEDNMEQCIADEISAIEICCNCTITCNDGIWYHLYPEKLLETLPEDYELM